ncbi:hypothetical protein LJR084_006628 [Variovorax sp. LjRoot84]
MRSVFSSSIISTMSSAARTAAALWSGGGSGSGAPKMVISPSPSSGDLR